ncbi:hypothetical protein PILCRDRAFT_815020 [Piloderma croceum F 1598]|uniref:Postreplication repair E3 ubiquitin-protein ligase RAD18 n=1 Tax=Piloderma croceum (strain F 1598) TaxID=765440 RepID=A0A0C3CCT6_PILCF|nr:hypothetical protein PILCRDRAFT_815020 [Piloderma croceum F 1598]
MQLGANADSLLALDTDIPDPTDFHSPSLRQLDSALRCTICSEWFDAPVTLACGHCFCSLCARNYINDKSECPSCRKAVNEVHLRANPVMEEVVSVWKLARPIILELLKADAEHRRSPNKTRKRKRDRSGTSRIPAPQSSEDDIESIAGPSNSTKTKKKTRSPPLSSSIRGGGNGDDGRVDDEENGDDEDDVFEEDVQSVIPTSDSREEELENDVDNTDNPPLSDGLVSCPLCSVRVKLETINTHIDSGCRLNPLVPDGNGDNKEKKRSSLDVKGQWSKIMGGARSAKLKAKATAKGKGKYNETTSDDQADCQPLPKESYAVLKDRKIKDMLLAYQLPTNGDRNTCIARHSRWVMTYNANLDKSLAQRKSPAELRAELRRWEELQKANAKRRERERESGEAVGEDVVRYQKANKTEFARLVEVARGSSFGKGKGESSTNPQSKAPSSTASVSASERGPPRSSVPMKADSVRNRKGVGGGDDDDDDIIVVDSEEELMIVPGAGS